MKKYTTLLIDLDGTLLDIEVSFFLGPMVEAMYRCFSDLMEKERFREALFGGTEAIMVEPRLDGENNMAGFNRAFSELSGIKSRDIEDRFRRFYTRVFPGMGEYGRPVDGAPRFVERARRAGYRLCLATNPIFPRSAVMARMRWADLDPGSFLFIPGLENMRTCKPRVEYFLELAALIEADPQDCLMVGNDMEQDLPAARTGMGTFLVEGQVVSRGITDLEPDRRGSLEDLAVMLGLV